MSSLPQSSAQDKPILHRSNRRRSAWRERLIDAERGFSFGLRHSSSLFGHLFLCAIIVLTAAILGVREWEWAALVVSMALGIGAEMYHLAVCVLAESCGRPEAIKAARLSAGGMIMAMLGAGAMILYIFGHRIAQLLS